METNKKSIVLFVQGGAGDVLAHTPMIRGMRKAYPEDEIIVGSTYAQLLENNPNIDKLIPLKEPKEFYFDNVISKNLRFYRKRFVYDYLHEKQDEYALGAKTLPEFICRCYGVEYDGLPLDYTMTEYEKRCADTFASQSMKPIVLLHILGSIASDGSMNKNNAQKDLNPKILEPLVNRHKDKFDFLQIGLQGEPRVEGSFDCLGMPMRDTIGLISKAATFIFIESLFAHCSNALGKRGVVVFQNTNPAFFGYSQNVNFHDENGCEKWPCDRPVGALMDFAAGYKDPKNRNAILWECRDHKCANISVDKLDKAFVESLAPVKAVADKGFATFEDARDAVPSVPMGCAVANPKCEICDSNKSVMHPLLEMCDGTIAAKSGLDKDIEMYAKGLADHVSTCKDQNCIGVGHTCSCAHDTQSMDELADKLRVLKMKRGDIGPVEAWEKSLPEVDK